VHWNRPFWMDPPASAGGAVTLGVDAAKTRFRIQPPFGKEMIVAIVSERPLFTKAQPLVEEERQFLTTFRRAILGLAAHHPGNAVAAAVLDLETAPTH
ncbi:MAG: hypothetical protein HQL35_13750, partial [Alphaproteobacteria bacterium]|nr:hypothetical protein [Alphaproteobacteria bacterium]